MSELSTDIAVFTLLTVEPICADSLSQKVSSPTSGAIVTFSGNVRNHDHGKSVLSLRYDIHPSSAELLERTVREVSSRHGVTGVAVAHRYGELAIGDAALVVAVASAHRAQAFLACSELVDEIKANIPIWKHQIFTDGSDEWVNCA